MKTVAEDLGSWLKYIHIEYLSDDEYVDLLGLDINDPKQQDELISRTLVPGFLAANAVSRKSLVAVLDEIPKYPQESVREMLWLAGPLAESLQDYGSFFSKVRDRCAPHVA